uniref:MYB transcription factor n=1 Tax=Lactuca sativa TaxID=4236 RepID=A0A9R1XIY4_LACSA|nr:hypothetical protein LSAT_V11C400194560 [Lactuca sativa]
MVQMAKERQKWTLEEEEALYYGVRKHGQGKWKVILTDPQFASALANRSNIDLKDKWRNVSVNRDKVRTPMLEGVTTTTTNNPPLNPPEVRTPLLEGVTTTTTTTNQPLNPLKVRTPLLEGVTTTTNNNPPLNPLKVRTPLLEGVTNNNNNNPPLNPLKVRTPLLEGVTTTTTNQPLNPLKIRTPLLEGVTTTTTTNQPLNPPKVRTPLLEGVTTTTTTNQPLNPLKVRTPLLEGVTTTITTNPPMNYPKPLSVVHLVDYGGMSVPSSSTMHETTPQIYEKLILEALSSIGDPNGSDTNAILSFIEKNFPVPENFERSVTSMLRRLVLTGKLEMVDNNFKYKGASYGAKTFKRDDSKNDKVDDEKQEAPDAPDSPIATETLEDAAFYAARLVSRAENVEQQAIEAVQKSDRIEKMVEESMAMLQLAEDLHEMCKLSYITFILFDGSHRLERWICSAGSLNVDNSMLEKVDVLCLLALLCMM